MSKLQETIDGLYKTRDALHKRMKALEETIQRAESLQREIESLGPEALNAVYQAFERHTEATSTQKRARNKLPPQEIARAAREVLLSAGKPLKRGDIVRLLEARGITLAGKDKNKNLGTILWRHSDMFTVIGDLGYWPKDTELSGVYNP